MSIAAEPFLQYGSFGLVAMVLIWFMYRNEKVLSQLTATQQSLINKIQQFCDEAEKRNAR